MALLKKYLVAVTPSVLHLLADGIDPREVIKQVLTEVDSPPAARDFVMAAPEQPTGWPNDMPQQVASAAYSILNMGLRIKRIMQPNDNGVISCEEICFDPDQGITGALTIWRHFTGGVLYVLVRSAQNTWIEIICGEGHQKLDVLLRILNYAVKVVAPNVRIHGQKTGSRVAKQMMAKFTARLGESASVDPKEFIMQQPGVFGYICRVMTGHSAGQYFTRTMARTLDWRPSPYIGDAQVFKRASTWNAWEAVRSGAWEILTVYSDPRKTGELALTGASPRKVKFKAPVPEDKFCVAVKAKELPESNGIEQRLADAARTIKHCGDYGRLYYHAGRRAVHWVAADSDSPENGYTDVNEIKTLLKLPGIAHVEIGDEWSPKADGWIRLDLSRPELPEAADLAHALLCESPRLSTLKQHRQSLDAGEREQAGKAPVWKSRVDGQTWYVSNTHRAYQAHQSLGAAVKAHWRVVEPSG